MIVKETVNGNSRYISAKLGWGEQFDFRELELLAAGASPALIPPEVPQGSMSVVIRYNISPYSTLRLQLAYILDRERFAALLLQCVEVFRQIQRSGLNYKNLVLDFDQIYVLPPDGSLRFIYLPLLESRREASIPDFFRRLIQSAGRSTYEQVSFLDGCLDWLNQSAPFSLDAFEAYIKGGPTRYVLKKGRIRRSAPGIGRSETGGAVMLSRQADRPQPRFYLTRARTGERVEINTSPFLVGTELGTVNYLVTGNTAVSRRHAQFSIQGGECQVTDQKSTNKTYVNNCALTPLVPQPLANGDKIRLGNDEFLFSREA